MLSGLILRLPSFGGLAQEAEEQGVPWYVWHLIIMALVVFVVFLYFWWTRGKEEERLKPALPPAKVVIPDADVPEAELPAMELPEVEVPKVELPEAELPDVEQPEAELPKVEVPALELVAPPDLGTRAPEVPDLGIDLPDVGAEPKVAAVPPVPDDLQLIEGIGPKIASVLNAAGIFTFEQLALIHVDQARDILERADPRLLRLADPTTWAEQADLAAKGDFEALKRLQDRLRRGRR
jgi:predicted flap endonuclease-1-like 5' DNA nuclease